MATLSSLRLLAARFALDLVKADELQQTAEALLDGGVYLPPVVELALTKAPTMRDSGPVFVRMLRAVGLKPLTEPEAVNWLLRDIFWGITEGVRTPAAGSQLLQKLYVELTGDPPRLDSDWAEAYGCKAIFHVFSVVGYPALFGSPRDYDELAGNLLAPLVEDWVRLNCHIPIDPTWLTRDDGNIPRLARDIRDNLAFDALPVLADALEEAGCTAADVLNHCRYPGPHVRDCWVLDLLLTKN